MDYYNNLERAVKVGCGVDSTTSHIKINFVSDPSLVFFSKNTPCIHARGIMTITFESGVTQDEISRINQKCSRLGTANAKTGDTFTFDAGLNIYVGSGGIMTAETINLDVYPMYTGE